MKKRYFTGILLLLICVLALASCADLWTFGLDFGESPAPPISDDPDNGNGANDGNENGTEGGDGHIHSYTAAQTVAPTCTKDGQMTYTCACGDRYSEEIPALGHDFIFADGDYFLFSECGRCGAHGARRESERVYDDVFVYTFDRQAYDGILAFYDEICDVLTTHKLAEGEEPPAFVKDSDDYRANKAFEEQYYNIFYEDLETVQEQYEYCYVFYCVADGDEEWVANFALISEAKSDLIAKYYALFGMIYDTSYRNYFFAEEDGWTEQDIRVVLAKSDTYSDPERIALQQRAAEIGIEFRGIAAPASDPRTTVLYEELLSINNRIAQLAGYDHYMDYAYAVEYNRDYTPSDVAQMRGYVKENLGADLFFNLILSSFYSSLSVAGQEWNDLYGSSPSISLFDSAAATEAIAGYLRAMGSLGDKNISFYDEINKLFRDGNYYRGDYEGAFSYYIPAQDATILYFGPDSYSSPFTFIHEFGHYMNAVYNGGADLSLDLCEVHSQGNEMLFLAYLNEYLPTVYRNGDTASRILTLDKLSEAAMYILLATAVDEFEYLCYSGDYDGENAAILAIMEDGAVTANEMDTLFEAVLGEYDLYGVLNQSYWRYVTIESPAYYISYSISLLPSVELFLIAETDGWEAAQDAYYHLFRFTDSPDNYEEDEYGNGILKVGFIETLTGVGMHSPFEEDLYVDLASYLEQLLLY